MTAPSAIRSIQPLHAPWRGGDPFLMMAHHLDHYPRGNGALAPVSGSEGRDRGSDFSGKDGWSLYHGGPVPGFPAHPHRGFETITIVARGYVDHADSVGGSARYGMGDVQWLTAGAGVLHSEMFPLVHADAENPLDLIQVWLNLPASHKMSPPHFSMFWAEAMPRVGVAEGVEVEVIAGTLDGVQALPPPPDSWASDPRSGLAIWVATLAPGASWTLPASAHGDAQRALHVLGGERLRIDTQELEGRHSVELQPDVPLPLTNVGGDAVRILVMEARPIGEPVVSYGPFVMNTEQEIRQTFADFERTRFGRWPFPTPAPTHGDAAARFAVFPDGRREQPAG